MLVNEQTKVNLMLSIKGIYARAVKKQDETIVANTNYQGILMFLNTKDDNLLLEIGALVHSIISLNPADSVKEKVPIIFGGEV